MLRHEQLRRLAKLAVTGGLHYESVPSHVRRKQTRGRGSSLMYHRVCDPMDTQHDSDRPALNRASMCSPASGREPLFSSRILGF